MQYRPEGYGARVGAYRQNKPVSSLVVKGAEVGKYLVNPAAHLSRVNRFVMGVSNQVQDTVYEEVEHHLVVGIAELEGFFPGPVRTDHHIAEEMRAWTGLLSFHLGEGEHIAGVVLASEFPVEIDHFFSIDDGYG